MIQITAADFKENLDKYLALAGQEEILIQKDDANRTQPLPPSWVDELIALVPPLHKKSQLNDPDKQMIAEMVAEKYESLD